MRLAQSTNQSGGIRVGLAGMIGAMAVPLENVYAILPGSDAKFVKTLFIVSGHMDSRPTKVLDPTPDAPGADDDASGTAVSVECARLLSKLAAGGQASLRATVLFAAVSGEEQGLLGSAHLLEWTKQQGYTVGGMLTDDIVGADSAPGGPHRVRLFSGNGDIEDCDSPSRELARAIEEIDGRDAIRLIFRVDRYGRGGDHYPFYKAGLPAVRFTEPLENYNHQHQTPRTENSVEYGDFEKYLNFTFMGDEIDQTGASSTRLSAKFDPATARRYAGLAGTNQQLRHHEKQANLAAVLVGLRDETLSCSSRVTVSGTDFRLASTYTNIRYKRLRGQTGSRWPAKDQV